MEPDAGQAQQQAGSHQHRAQVWQSGSAQPTYPHQEQVPVFQPGKLITGEHDHGSPANNVSSSESDSDQSAYYSDSIISDIGQFDGNVSVCSNKGSHQNINVQPKKKTVKPDKITAALSLPTIATYNCRSLFPKVESLKTDLLERKIDVGFLQEVWQQTTNSDHQYAIEKMLELSGLQYFSTTRPPNKKEVSYGGAAIQTWKKTQTRRHCLRKFMGIAEIIWQKHLIYSDLMHKVEDYGTFKV